MKHSNVGANRIQPIESSQWGLACAQCEHAVRNQMCYTENFFTAPWQRLLGVTSPSGHDLLQRPRAQEDKAAIYVPQCRRRPLQMLLHDYTRWFTSSCLIVRPSTDRNFTHKHLIWSSRLLQAPALFSVRKRRVVGVTSSSWNFCSGS